MTSKASYFFCNWNSPLFPKLETAISLDFVGKILRAIHFSYKAVAMAGSIWSYTFLAFWMWTNKYLWECNISFLTVAKNFAFKRHYFIVALVIEVPTGNSHNNYFLSLTFVKVKSINQDPAAFSFTLMCTVFLIKMTHHHEGTPIYLSRTPQVRSRNFRVSAIKKTNRMANRYPNFEVGNGNW